MKSIVIFLYLDLFNYFIYTFFVYYYCTYLLLLLKDMFILYITLKNFTYKYSLTSFLLLLMKTKPLDIFINLFSTCILKDLLIINKCFFKSCC